MIGNHNMSNGLAAIAAAHHVGIPIQNAVESLTSFKSVKRRMELIFENDRVRVFDDFAHHPTAISETLTGLRHRVKKEKIVAILEPRSNTMKRGVHKHLLEDALKHADIALIFADNNVQWDIKQLRNEKIQTFDSTEELLAQAVEHLSGQTSYSNVLIMSNGGFENLYQRLINELSYCDSLL